jgi:hypothetical protein
MWFGIGRVTNHPYVYCMIVRLSMLHCYTQPAISSLQHWSRRKSDLVKSKAKVTPTILRIWYPTFVKDGSIQPKSTGQKIDNKQK